MKEIGQLKRLFREGHKAEEPSVEYAQSQIARVFVNHRLELRDGRPPRLIHFQAALGALTFNQLAYESSLDVAAPALPDFYLFQITLSGRTAIVAPSFQVELCPGSMFVMNPGIPYRKHWSADARQLIVKIPADVLTRQLREELESNSIKRVEFSHGALSLDQGASLLRYFAMLSADLYQDDGISQFLHTADHLQRSVLSALLNVIPNSHSEMLNSLKSPAAPRHVIRAEDYIRANPARRISMAELTAIAGVSERSLQEGFRRFRGTTPMQALRDARLDHARSALIVGRQRVTTAALEAGFSHLGRFARNYFDRFGETPSETIRKGMRPPT